LSRLPWGGVGEVIGCVSPWRFRIVQSVQHHGREGNRRPSGEVSVALLQALDSSIAAVTGAIAIVAQIIDPKRDLTQAGQRALYSVGPLGRGCENTGVQSKFCKG